MSARNEEEGTAPSPFREAAITSVPKPDKHNTKGGNYTPISLVNIDTKILNKTQANRTQQQIIRIPL